MAEPSSAPGAMSPPTGQAAATPSTMAPPSVTFPAKSIAALGQYSARDNSKILVRFKAIGGAPIMKTNGFRITAFNKFQAVIIFLKKALSEAGAGAGAGSLFLYINNSFCPSPEDTVGNLFRCFGTDGHLIVNYSTTPAFG